MRIDLIPRFESFIRLFQVSRHLAVVSKFDKEALKFADAISQLPGFPRALSGQDGLSMGAIRQTQLSVRQSEVRIYRDCPLEKRDRRSIPGRNDGPQAGTVRFEGIQ